MDGPTFTTNCGHNTSVGVPDIGDLYELSRVDLKCPHLQYRGLQSCHVGKELRLAYTCCQMHLKGHPNGVPTFPTLLRLDHACVAKLPQNEVIVKLTRSLAVVGCDAADEVWVGVLQGLHYS